MAEVANAFVTLTPSAKGFGGAIQREIGGKVEQESGRSGRRAGAFFSRSFIGPLGAVGVAAAGLFAVDKVAGFFKDSISEARESQKVNALTASTIKATGGAAKVTATQVGDLATAISNKTGIDDEQVQASENMLLTFKGVRNEVGKGNDIFNQATQTVTDMSAALGQSGKASAIQLGKALNDPIKGVSALSRVGVTFTDQQKKQIGTMVKSGDTLGAQKVILHELNSEFGGAAASSATAGEKFKTTFSNFKESIGTALLPVIDLVLGGLSKLFGWLTTKVGPAFDRFKSFIKPVTDTAAVFIGTITGQGSDGGGLSMPWMKKVIDAGAAVSDAFFDVKNVVTTVFDALSGKKVSASGGLGQLGSVVSSIRSAFLAAIPVVSRFVTGTLIPLLSRVVGFIRAAVPVIVQFVTGTVIPFLRQAVTFIKTQVIPGVMGIIDAFRGLITRITPIALQIVAVIRTYFPQIAALVRQVFDTVKSVIVSALSIIRSVIKIVTAVITKIWDVFGKSILSIIKAVLGTMIGVISGALTIIKGVFKLFSSLLKGDWRGAWNAIKEIVSGAWKVIKSLISGAFGVIKGIFSGALSGLKALFSAAWNALKSVVSGAWDRIKSAVSTGIGKVMGLVKALPGQIVNALVGFDTMLYDTGVNLIEGLWNGIKSMGSWLAGKVIGFVKEAIPGPIRKAMGIQSPSRVMADEVGKWIPLGLAQGIDSHASAVHASMSRVISLVARPSVQLGAGAAMAGAAGGGVVFNGPVHTNSVPGLVELLDERESRTSALRPAYI